MPKPGSKSRPPSVAQATPARGHASVAGSRVFIQAAVVFAIAIAVRGLHFFFMRDSLFFDVLVCDGRQYDLWGQGIAGGEWIGTKVFYQTPLYPYFLGITYAVFGHSVWAVRILQALIGSAACVMGARAGAGFFSERVGWIVGLLLAVYPPALFFDGIIQKASLDLAFMTGLLWTLSAAQRSPRGWLFLVLGLLLGAMTLNRENAAVLVPLFGIWILWLSWKGPKLLIAKRLVAFGLGMMLLLVPVGLRNYYVGGQFLLTTSQMGPNFYIGNHQGATGLYVPLRPGRGDPIFESVDARQLAEDDLGRTLSPREISNYWMQRSLEDMRSDPGVWLRLIMRKWFLTWNAYEFVDAESLHSHQLDSPLLNALGWVLHFGVLCPLAAMGTWFTRHEWRRLWVLYGMLLAFALAVTIFFVFARYRYPLVPLAALFAGAGVDAMWMRWQARRFGDMFPALGCAALVAIACNWPLAPAHSDAVAYITVGTGLLDDNRPAEAERVLAEAVRLNPDSMEGLNNLAIANLQLNRLDAAERFYRESAKKAPAAAAPVHGLGEVYLKRKNLPAAIGQWRHAMELEPYLSAPYISLGTAAIDMKDFPQAIEYLRKAVEFEPTSARARIDLATALIATDQIPQAAEQLKAAISLQPSLQSANNLAWMLATAPDDRLRNASEALRLAELACRVTGYESPDFLDTLAAAHANAGDYDQAIVWAKKGIERAKAINQPAIAKILAEHLEVYKAHSPVRDQTLVPRK